MPFDGSGNFNRVMNWVSDAAANIKIRADRHDQEDDNLASGLSNTLTKDGQSQPTADIPMNGKKLINLAAPTDPTDAATKGYADALRDFNTAINLTGAVPQARIGFTQADIGFGARVAGTPAGFPNRFVWNTEPDLSGTDLLELHDTGGLIMRTGPILIKPASGDASLYLDKAAAGNQSLIWGRRGDLNRWTIVLGNGTAESGANVGSDFSILRYTDAGDFIGSALSIIRSSGQVSVANNLTVGGTATVGTNLQSSAPNLVLGGSGAGGIFLRPRGIGDGTGQTIIDTNGVVSTSAALNVTGNINASGNIATANLISGGTLQCAPYLTTGTAALIMGHATGASTIYFRPQGVQSNLNQTYIDTGGTLSTAGIARAEAYQIGWNGMATAVANWLVNTGAVGFHIDYSSAFPAMRFYLGSIQTFQTPGTGIWTFPANCTKPGGGPFGDSSDERIKNVVGEYDRGLDAIMGLRPVVYTFKGNDTPDPPSATSGPPEEGGGSVTIALSAPYANSNHYMQAEAGTQFVGLIAQEVETVMPGMVTQRSGYIDGEPVDDIRDLDTSILIFAVVNSIKELATRVEQLEQAA